ncbi:hypothetical protein [Burkholderia sp. Ac-20392]|uniref:hypothetical protein n=1 Tax=Burkholderia sp. Ac-20392 TaxID=2703905 RepID=UPI001F120C2D|nr:hypothetical protein [Burkholderia sp. Ac-20392]
MGWVQSFVDEFTRTVAFSARALKADAATFSDNKEIFLPGNSVLVSPEPGAGRLHQQIQSIEVGKFGRLITCRCLSDLDGIKWHGENVGIVAG